MTDTGLIFVGIFLGMLAGAGVGIYKSPEGSTVFTWQVALGKVLGAVLGAGVVITVLIARRIYVGV